MLEQLQSLMKAIEAGNYDVAPSQLIQGASLQSEELSPVMHNVTFEEKDLKLQKMVGVESCKSLLCQFNRQLSYGQFGGSAQTEGAVGQEETSDYVRVVVPMCFYSHTRRVTLQAMQVATVDGKKADERAAADAAKKLAGDIEFDLFRGKDQFSNAGVFDGNPLTIPESANMLGLGAQVRQSDAQRNARDMMFAEYGSDDSVVINVGGALKQGTIEDAHVRSSLNFGTAEKLIVDPRVLSAYTKIAYDRERIVLAGSAQDATGADLRRQFVSGGTVNLEESHFLRAKVQPKAARNHPNAPSAPTIALAAGGATGSLAAGTYSYYVTSENEIGESPRSGVSSQAVLAGQYVTVTITAPVSGTVRWYNVYRGVAGASAAASLSFIGRVAATSTGASFIDLGNRIPKFVTGFLVQGDTMGMKELMPFSRIKLAVVDLSQTEAYARFVTLEVTQPRKNVILDSLQG